MFNHAATLRKLAFRVHASLTNIRRTELIKSESKRVDAKFAKMESRFDAIDARFAQMDARFKTIDSKFASMESRFASMEAAIHGVKSEVHRLALLVEEQNARNAIVMDGLTVLFSRQRER